MVIINSKNVALALVLACTSMATVQAEDARSDNGIFVKAHHSFQERFGNGRRYISRATGLTYGQKLDQDTQAYAYATSINGDLMSGAVSSDARGFVIGGGYGQYLGQGTSYGLGAFISRNNSDPAANSVGDVKAKSYGVTASLSQVVPLAEDIMGFASLSATPYYVDREGTTTSDDDITVSGTAIAGVNFSVNDDLSVAPFASYTHSTEDLTLSSEKYYYRGGVKVSYEIIDSVDLEVDFAKEHSDGHRANRVGMAFKKSF